VGLHEVPGRPALQSRPGRQPNEVGAAQVLVVEADRPLREIIAMGTTLVMRSSELRKIASKSRSLSPK
jgi:hypothetical protein